MLKTFSIKTVPRFIAAGTFALILAPPILSAYEDCGTSSTECELRERLERLEKQVRVQQEEIEAQQAEIQALKRRWALTDGLVAYYPFDGNANDVSGNGHHGEVHGATLVKGKFGNAYSFNGKDSRIKLSASAIQGTELTVNIWLTTKDKNDGSIISGANHPNHNEYLIYLGDAKKLVPCYHNKSTNSDVSVNDNKWHNLTVVTEVEQTRIYLDGLFKKTLEFGSKTPFKVEGLWLGGDQDYVNGGWEAHNQFEGLMDELRIYNRALTDVEIKHLYKQR
jgi:hypothetical protein